MSDEKRTLGQIVGEVEQRGAVAASAAGGRAIEAQHSHPLRRAADVKCDRARHVFQSHRLHMVQDVWVPDHQRSFVAWSAASGARTFYHMLRSASACTGCRQGKPSNPDTHGKAGSGSFAKPLSQRGTCSLIAVRRRMSTCPEVPFSARHRPGSPIGDSTYCTATAVWISVAVGFSFWVGSVCCFKDTNSGWVCKQSWQKIDRRELSNEFDQFQRTKAKRRAWSAAGCTTFSRPPGTRPTARCSSGAQRGVPCAASSEWPTTRPPADASA